MTLYLESGYTSLNKTDEELCGDKVEYFQADDNLTLVLADGLGSGVKANILSTLTSKILCTMISNGVKLEDCIETILHSLPVCKIRKVAYSTFSILHVDDEGKGYLFEFDNPQAILIHNGRCCDLKRETMHVLGKTVYKSELCLEADDVVVLMSDGAIHAGVGMTLNFGWDRKEIMEYIDRQYRPELSARSIACLVATACNELYLDKPGDDTTIAAVKIRKKLKVNIMVGPPVDKTMDHYYVNHFLQNEGMKIVCGGTSSLIVARYLNKEVKTSFDFLDNDVPPIGHIEGIDLTTEGVLTLRKLLQLSERYLSIHDLTPKSYQDKDGASLLADMLFEKATHVTFFVGQSVNAAHQGLPVDITMKLKLVESLSNNLRSMGKRVEVNYC